MSTTAGRGRRFKTKEAADAYIAHLKEPPAVVPAAGCDGRDIRADVDTFPEKIGPRCGNAHVIEITREGWDRPVRLCRVHADRAHLTDAEKVTLNGH